MNENHYMVANFVEEIFGIVLPQLGVIEVNRFNVGRGPAPFHQWERDYKENSIHDIRGHIERGVLPNDFANLYSVISLAKLSDKILAQLKE
jgi:hypothetical protein